MKLLQVIFFCVALTVVKPLQALQLQANNVCKMVTFIPFTDMRESIPEAHAEPGVEYYGYGSWPNAETLAKASFSLMASAELALTHFNARDTSIVPELGELGSCDIQLETEKTPGGESYYLDSAYSRSATVKSFLDMTYAAIEGAEPRSSFCGAIGPVEPRASEGFSVLSESQRIPQVAYSTIDRRLSRKDDFPLFARVIPAAADFGKAVAEYLVRGDVLTREFLGIIYDQSDYGEQFEDPLEDYEDLFDYDSLTEHIIEGDDASIYSSLGDVVERGYRTIVLITDRPAFLNAVARIAEELGLLGEGYFWVLSGDSVPSALLPTTQHKVDSPLDKLLRGAAVFTNYDPFVYNGESDPFLKAWRSQDETLVERLNSVQPRQANGENFYTAEPSYFQTETPAEYASFIYDAVISLGIGACKALQSLEADPFNTTNHYEQILNSDFQGASGPVAFKIDEEEDELTNGRDPSGVLFGMHNIQRGAVEDGMQSYDLVLTSVYSYENEFVNADGTTQQGAWRAVESAEFLFFDGTTAEPMPKITTADQNYLSSWVRILGFTLIGFSLFCSLGSALWVFLHRKTRGVKASQPEFLYLLCFGAALVSSSLIFLTFDESQGWSEAKLSASCSAFPWFFVIGYLLMYCALFSKLWRLSKLLSMRRRAVGIQTVLWPFCFIIAASFIILIVWQIVKPLQWVRTTISEEPYETWGECKSDDTADGGLLPFVLSLLGLFAVIIGMTAVVAWRMKDVQAELSESKWIFFGIYSHIQTWAVGLPIVIITDNVSRDASYLMMAALVFIFSTSMVGPVIGPKIFVWARDKYFGGAPKVNAPISALTSGGGVVQVSGLDTGNNWSSGQSSRSSEALGSKVKDLENEVSELKKLLADAKEDGPPEPPPEQSPA